MMNGAAGRDDMVQRAALALHGDRPSEAERIAGASRRPAP